ncbi:hypothetical protein [Nocardia concava]|uniref:hypothetical protein n=1 Tax=Nocardia concava TaxID=257281 RepID=UPI0003077C02|nr:hypothetical protein [Nocardia concava]
MIGEQKRKIAEFEQMLEIHTAATFSRELVTPGRRLPRTGLAKWPATSGVRQVALAEPIDNRSPWT